MVKAIIIAMPRLTLVTTGVRSDFEGTMNLVQKAKRILCQGFRADFSFDHSIKATSIKELAVEFNVRKYIRHYNEVFDTYEITTFLYGKKVPEIVPRMNLKKVIAYGNVLEYSFENVDIEYFFKMLPDLNRKIENSLNPSVARKLYEMYLGSQLVTKEKRGYFVSPILSMYLAVLIAETPDEYKKIFEKYKTSFSLIEVLKNAIAVGEKSSTDFPYERDLFFSISLNPLLVNMQEKDDYQFVDIFGSMFYFLSSIGESYNILSIMSEALELCVLSETSTPNEIYGRIGRFKINPLKDLFGLYGLRDFQKYEKKWHYTLIESVNYIRTYKTKGSQIIWAREGVPPFPQITLLNELITSYKRFEPDKIIFKSIAADDFASRINEKFDRNIEEFTKTLNSLFGKIEPVIERSRTTVQLNIAIMALFWTVVFTVVLSPEVFGVLKSIAENIWRYLINLGTQIQNPLLQK